MNNKDYPLYNVIEISTIKELIYSAASENGDSIAFKYTKKKKLIHVTYLQLKEHINCFGTSLFDKNVENCNVAILGGNSYEWILSYLTILSGNNVVVPLDKELQVAELEEAITESMCKVLIYDNSYSDIIDKLKNMELSIELYINMNELETYISNGKYLIDSNKRNYIDCKVQEESLASIVYTSGTSGKSKGVMLTHKNIISDGLAASKSVLFSDTTMIVLPLHHTFCIIASVIGPIICRRTIYINSSLKKLMNDFVLVQPQNVALVPLFIETMNKKIWDTIEKENKVKLVKMTMRISNFLLSIGIDLRPVLFKKIRSTFGGNLEIIISGGAMLDEKYIKEFRAFGIQILNGYGITECSPVIAVNRNKYYRDGSVGQVLSGCDVKIAEDGEILVKGDIVMKGYYNNKIETERVFTNGWFRTGDIGYIDEDSFLYITGRIKNLIILANGKNVSPEELEMQIVKLKGIKEAIVYDDNGVIASEIYPDYGFLEEISIKNIEEYIKNQINEFNKNIAPYKRINNVKLREEEFSKTTTKKIKRYKAV